MRRRVIVLGSTGSIGTQALDVIRRNPERFELVGVSANNNRELIEQQRQEFDLGSHQVAFGAEASAELARASGADVVLNGLSGAAGLLATIATLESGKVLALANKESLIIGGPIVKALAQPNQIVPVDSEHSALAQCLRSGASSEVKKLVLTASGGPFRGWSFEQLQSVTPAQALKHPTWNMGRLVTTNSASMVNKGLELIEAHLLFDVPLDLIEVTVHPQSVVHSMVEFNDGSTIAQVSPPDMRLPIALGISWPDRVDYVIPAVDWGQAHTWTFEPLNESVFQGVKLARIAAGGGGTLPAVFNAANEIAVDAFHDGLIGFTEIWQLISETMSAHQQAPELTLDAVLAADVWARGFAAELCKLSGL